MTHDMTLRGAMVVSFGLILGCYGMPPNGGSHDGGAGGAAGSAAAGTGGTEVAGHDGGAGTAGGAGAGRDGKGGAAGGGQGGFAGGGRGGSLGGGRGGSSAGAGAAASGGSGGGSGIGGAAGAGGGGGIAGGGAGGGGAGGGGACTPACDATHACAGGRCLLAEAQPCITASQCASGACNPFYKDVDGDGYGTGQAVGFCALTAPPIGYAAQTGDCCDDATNIALAKLIHPGADFQITSAGGICNGITWDYDCSGMFEKAGTYCASCTDSPACECVVAQFADSDCGRHVAFPGCGKAATAVGILCINAGGDGPLGCR
jgi:hypothetical protein